MYFFINIGRILLNKLTEIIYYLVSILVILVVAITMYVSYSTVSQLSGFIKINSAWDTELSLYHELNDVVIESLGSQNDIFNDSSTNDALAQYKVLVDKQNNIVSEIKQNINHEGSLSESTDLTGIVKKLQVANITSKKTIENYAAGDMKSAGQTMSMTDSNYSDVYEKISDISDVLYAKQQGLIQKYHEKSISSDFKEKMLLTLIAVLFLLMMILGYVVTLRHRRLHATTLKAKVEVKFRETKLKNIIETVDDAVITMDSNAIVTYVNEPLLVMFGYTADEVVGFNIKMLMPSNMSANHDSYMYKYEKNGKQKIINKSRVEFAQRKDGEIFPIRLRVTEVLINSEKQFTGVIHDLSESYRNSNYNDMVAGFQKLLIDGSELDKYYVEVLKYSVNC